MIGVTTIILVFVKDICVSDLYRHSYIDVCRGCIYFCESAYWSVKSECPIRVLSKSVPQESVMWEC